MCACLCTCAHTHTVHMICFAGGAPRHNYFKQFYDPPAEVETLVMDQSLDVIEPVFKHTRRTGSAKPNETHVYILECLGLFVRGGQKLFLK